MNNRPFFAQLTYFLTSRRRQAEVVRLEYILLLICVGFLVGRLAGDPDTFDGVGRWFALLPSMLAAFLLAQFWGRFRRATLTSAAVVVGVLGLLTVVLPLLAFVLSADVALLWPLTGILFGLGLLWTGAG